MRVLTTLLLALAIQTATATVDRVTIYPGQATVTRIIEQRVTAGPQTVEATDLPVGLDRDSLRVRAVGPEGLRLGAIEFRIVRGAERVNPAVQALEERLRDLNDQRTRIADRIAARDLELALLNRLTQATGQDQAEPAQLLDQLGRLGTEADRVYAERRDLLLEQRALSEQIERLQRELNDLGQAERDTLALAVELHSPAPGPAKIELEYTVHAASWVPRYEWRLDTETATLQLVQSAEIRQSTGEDWTDARISVSLANPAQGGQLPELYPWWLDVVRPAPQTRAKAMAPEAAELSLDSISATGRRSAEADWEDATLSGTVLTQRYDLPGRISIASDNRPRRFPLDEHDLPVTLTARAVPQRNPAAWIFVEGRWTGESYLPPGDVQLYQDGVAMGAIPFDGLASGSELRASFGVDPNIEIQSRRVRQERKTEGLFNKQVREIREDLWRITNHHDRPVQLVLLGQLPVARDERIEVALTDRSTRPDRTEVDQQPGRVAWDLQLAPGETRELVFGITVSWPEELPGITGW
ncbi:MAG: mucoidy inhibitor MuiA family protein [Wenzhouxiangellaceae bacterium]